MVVDRPTSQPAAHLRSRARTSAGRDGAAQTVEGASPLSACYQLLSRGRRRSWCGVYLWPPPAPSHPIARSLCPYHQRPIRARLPARPHSAARSPARPRGATVEGLWVRRCFWQSPPGTPLPFSPFSGTRDGRRSPRSLSAFFVSPRITTGKTARKMHLLCKHAAVTREDGWKEELVTHSGAIQLLESRSLALSPSRAS